MPRHEATGAKDEDVTTALSDDVERGGINGNLGAANGRILSCHDYPASPHYSTRHWAMVLYGNSARQDFGDLMNERHLYCTYSFSTSFPPPSSSAAPLFVSSFVCSVFLRALPPLLRPAWYLSLVVMTLSPT